MQITSTELNREQALTVIFGKSRIAVKSFAEASKVYRDMIEAKDLGASSAPQCRVRNADIICATISYNGKVFAA